MLLTQANFGTLNNWQATVTLQLAICVVALILGAMLLSPIRHLPWRRRAPADGKT